MSWDVTLNDPNTGKPMQVPNHSEGGTYALGGTTDACLNVTYNHSNLFGEVLSEERRLDCLDGWSGLHTLIDLSGAITQLGNEPPDEDYWKPTRGNARKALAILLFWAALHPEGIWEVK